MHFRNMSKFFLPLFFILIIGGPATLFTWERRIVQQNTSQTPRAGDPGKVVGTIKLIHGNSITISSDSGNDMVVIVDSSTRLVRVAPGQKDLKDAIPIALASLEIGDRILARGKAFEDGQSFEAIGIMVMKHSDVEAKQARDREAWQRNGVGGLVRAVDVSHGIVTISTATLAGKRDLSIHVSKFTIIRHYAPDSVRFDDAQPSRLDQVKAGDQLRVRATGSLDGNELRPRRSSPAPFEILSAR